MAHVPDDREFQRHQTVGLLLAPVVAFAILLLPAPDGLSAAAWRTAALGVWMAVWWATEAVPLAATALLPIPALPLLGIADARDAAAPYAHPTIFLFFGGFVVALALQRHGLHRRIALAVIDRFGGSGASLVGGFMLAAALVSMWVTNTATTMMLLPIAVSTVAVVQNNLPESAEVQRNFPVALLLGTAYGATIGGTATLVGTPPNALLAAFLAETYGTRIGFAQWMLVGLPTATCMLPLCWWLLTRRLYPVGFSTGGAARGRIARSRSELGPMGRPERRVACVFALLALCWVGRPLLAGLPGLGGLTDTGVAMLAALSLFVLPAGAWRGGFLLRWRDTAELPWGILLLFGGGLSLASAVSDTGLAAWLGQRLLGLGVTRLVFLVLIVSALIVFLTELTSNLATTATFLPVVAALADEAGLAPLALTVPVALAASCAFMLPVATPPNAVVFGSGMLTVPQMIRAGFWLNLLAIAVVTAVSVALAPRVLG